jgi:hypothetical protein
MSNNELESTQRLGQRNCFSHDEVITSSLEVIMIFLLKYKDQIPSLHIRLQKYKPINFIVHFFKLKIAQTAAFNTNTASILAISQHILLLMMINNDHDHNKNNIKVLFLITSSSPSPLIVIFVP